MKKFLVLYKAPMEEFTKAMQTMKPEDQEASKKEWMDWMTKNKPTLADMGAPVGKTKIVTKAGATDGHNDIGGYSVVQADNADDAAKIFADSPHFTRMNGTIELSEIMAM